MTIHRILLFFLTALLVLCCKEVEKDYEFIDGYNYYLSGIPDSLATESQLKLKQAINDLLWERLCFKNGKMKFPVSKEEMMERGIPGEYYNHIKRSLRDNYRNTNKMRRRYKGIMDIPDNDSLEILFEEARKEYWENRYKEPGTQMPTE